MLQGSVVIAVALGYIGLLFVVASYGDRARRAGQRRPPASDLSAVARHLLHVLDLLRLGRARLRTGFDFLTIYLGPMLMIGLGSPLIMRIVRLAKAQNITSIADFIAARYGKAQTVAATVALIAIIGAIPYIALQLKAVSSSLSTILMQSRPESGAVQPVLGDISLFVALCDGDLRGAVRHPPYRRDRAPGRTDAGDRDRIDRQARRFRRRRRFRDVLDVRRTARSVRARLEARRQLPRSSRTGPLSRHFRDDDAVVVLRDRAAAAPVSRDRGREQQRGRDQARHLAVSALSRADQSVRGADRGRRPLTFEPGAVDSDMFVLALPLAAHSDVFTIVAFVGGLSAATAMVIVEIGRARDHGVERHRHAARAAAAARRSSASRGDVGWLLLTVRRIAIFVILLLAYMYYRSPATRSSPRSGCSRSRRSRSSRRPSSAA